MALSAGSHVLMPIAPGLYRFDTGYLRASHTACYIVVEAGRAGIIDTGVPASVPPLLGALNELGVAHSAVDWVLPTHVHLDHAGGAAALMQALPNARLGIHPSGSQHMIDPSRLEIGVRGLYGDDFFDREYAPLLPIESDRVDSLTDDAVIEVGGRRLRIMHTPGHAWHHYSVFDETSITLMAGDAFGAGYPDFGEAGAPFVVPVVPPPQFNPEAYHQTLANIVALAPAQIAPAHFPLIETVADTAQRLAAMFDAGLEQAAEADSAKDLEARLTTVWSQWLPGRVDRADYQAAYGKDIWLTSEGMWLWRCKQERKEGVQT
jgi:glyoxylase-like metal-dependent hydrolase (beta-lactamase superfamily II)